MLIKPEKDSAHVQYPPPLVMILLIFIGRLIQQFWPLEIDSTSDRSRILGAILIPVSLLLILKCAKKFRDAGTHIEPWKSTSSLQRNGPYRFSRNPIYLGLSGMSLGFALVFNSVWVLMGALGMILFLNFYVIPKEEAYLRTKFGTTYTDYLKRVRRWI